MYNKVLMIGRVVKEPTLKYTQQGKAVSSFSLAVDRANEETDFFDIVAFDKQAEIASKYLTKGRLIMIEGRIQTRNYEAQDGTKRKVYEIVVESFRMLDKKPEQDKKTDFDRKQEEKRSEKFDKYERKTQKDIDDFDSFEDFEDDEFVSNKSKNKTKSRIDDDFDDFFFDDN
ncbi:MAG: single-stranded DNA-binding protein [bacterium]